MATIVPTTCLDADRYKNVFKIEEDEIPMTRALIEKSWSRHFPTVLPEQVILNKNCVDYEWEQKDGEHTLVEVDVVAYLVPFTKAVEQFLSIPAVNKAVLENFDRNQASFNNTQESPCEVVYSDILDGSMVKSNPVYVKCEGRVLAFQFYYDDAELGNPLGSKKGKNKIAFFYWTIMNLPPEARSNLRAIQLLGCLPTDFLKTYGFKNFLAPVLQALKKFQEGIPLTTCGLQATWHGFLANCVGDMPALNSFSGFKETAAASKPCRLCFVSKDDLDSVNKLCLCIIRDKESYEQQVNEINDPALSKKESEDLKKRYGINSSCCLSELDYIDPTKCFCHDLMHIGYEGILYLESCLLLEHLSTAKVIAIEGVNHFISSLPFHREFTRPPPLREEEIKEKKSFPTPPLK